MARRLDLEKFRKLLEEEHARVQSEFDALHTQAHAASQEDEVGELASYDQHQGDVGTETFLRERDFALEASAETILRQIEVALRKIDEGTYGICERCGKEIAAARLQAIPYTPFCIECAARVEGQG
jgi:RNA polymerase-binding protein DksA